MAYGHEAPAAPFSLPSMQPGPAQGATEVADAALVVFVADTLADAEQLPLLAVLRAAHRAGVLRMPLVITPRSRARACGWAAGGDMIVFVHSTAALDEVLPYLGPCTATARTVTTYRT